METIYRSPAGRAAVLAAYDRRLAALPPTLRSRTVATCFGETHALLAGPEGGSPLVLVHGGNQSALDLAGPLGALAERHRCVFVDVPGEPNRSSERRPRKTDDGYARWMRDVLDALELPRVAMLGSSQGGFVALKCAAVMPARVTRLALLMPEGLTRTPLGTLLRVVLWPTVRYRVAPTEANVRRFVAALSSPGAAPAPELVEHMGLVLRHVRPNTGASPLFTARDLAGFQGPALVVAGGRDVLYPGDRVARRAREVLPTLRDAVVVPGAGHLHVEPPDGPVMQQVRAFLAA